MDTQTQEQVDAQTAVAANRSAISEANQMARQAIEERMQNPEFLDKLQDADVNSEVHDWLEDEIGPPLSGAHILGNMEEMHRHRQRWLNYNKVERMVAEQQPGRLCREHPYLLRIAQGVHKRDDKDLREPLTSDEKRVLRDVAEVLTVRQSLAVEAEGLESVTTATTETRNVQNSKEESSGFRGKVRGYLK